MLKGIFKKKSVVIVSAVLAITLIVGVFAGVFGRLNSKKSALDPVINGDHVYADDEYHENGDSIAFPSTLLFSLAGNNSGQGISVVLNALVTPTSAPDKSVDWSVEWESGASRATEKVTDYIKVTPAEDDTTTATVTCYKAFAGDNIIITVTTRVGGYTASCVCSFEGTPSSLKFNTNNFTVKNETFGSSKVDILPLSVGGTYTIPLEYDNIYGSVGNSYVPSLKITSIKGYGEFKLKVGLNKGDIFITDNIDSYLGRTKVFNLSTFVNVEDLSQKNEYLNCRIEGNNLVIKGSRLVESLKINIISGESQVSYNAFDSLVKNTENPYLAITVTDTITGYSSTINVRLVSDISGVTLSQDVIVY